MQNIEPF